MSASSGDDDGFIPRHDQHQAAQGELALPEGTNTTHWQRLAKYLARYFKGGPVRSSQVQRDSNGVSLRYKSHRTGRQERKRNSGAGFCRQLLVHSASDRRAGSTGNAGLFDLSGARYQSPDDSRAGAVATLSAGVELRLRGGNRRVMWQRRDSPAVTIPIGSAGVERRGGLSNKVVQADCDFYLGGWCGFTKR